MELQGTTRVPSEGDSSYISPRRGISFRCKISARPTFFSLTSHRDRPMAVIWFLSTLDTILNSVPETTNSPIFFSTPNRSIARERHLKSCLPVFHSARPQMQQSGARTQCSISSFLVMSSLLFRTILSRPTTTLSQGNSPPGEATMHLGQPY